MAVYNLYEVRGGILMTKHRCRILICTLLLPFMGGCPDLSQVQQLAKTADGSSSHRRKPLRQLSRPPPRCSSTSFLQHGPGHLYIRRAVRPAAPERRSESPVRRAYLTRRYGARLSKSSEVRFHVPEGCHLMTDAGVRLLSLMNQLDHSTRRVLVEFHDDESGVLGYLNRIGFVESLSPDVEVLPKRPIFSVAARYRGRNPSLVEIERIDRKRRDSTLQSGEAGTATSDTRVRQAALADVFLKYVVTSVVEHAEDALPAARVRPRLRYEKLVRAEAEWRGYHLRRHPADRCLALKKHLRGRLRDHHSDVRFAGIAEIGKSV